MDELKELLALIAEDKKEAAGKLIEAVKAKITALDGEVNKQESQKLEAIKTRDEAKAKLKEVSSKVGADDKVTIEEAIENLKKSRSKSDDNTAIKDKEIAQLQSELQTITEKTKGLEQKHRQETLKLLLEKDTATLLTKYKAKTNATGYITDHILKLAQFEEGQIKFKNTDGTTLRFEGKDASVEDVIKSMKEGEVKSKESMFFDITIEQSGPGHNKGGEATGDFTPGQGRATWA